MVDDPQRRRSGDAPYGRNGSTNLRATRPSPALVLVSAFTRESVRHRRPRCGEYRFPRDHSLYREVARDRQRFIELSTPHPAPDGFYSCKRRARNEYEAPGRS